ncbi:MAG: DUF1611 domain-containing protein [Chitinophagales bacterium]
MKKSTAIILTNGLFSSQDAKTAHGLVRGTARFDVLGIIDHNEVGKDAGTLVDGKHRNIPIFASLEDAIAQIDQKIEFAILGVATVGGVIPEVIKNQLLTVLEEGIGLVNGLHQFVSEMPELVALAAEKGVELIDVRKMKPREELHFWDGSIFDVECPIIGILGTDCATGKRTTTSLLTQYAQNQKVNAQMIYTGQTGWMLGVPDGLIFDSTLNDFVSGELEAAIVKTYHRFNPEFILLEGQAALYNPSGPCGSEYLISGNAKGVILQHAPARTYFKGWNHLGLKIPPLQKYIDLIRLYDAEVLAITLNTQHLSEAEARQYQKTYEKAFGLPVILPMEEEELGMQRLLEVLHQYKESF